MRCHLFHDLKLAIFVASVLEHLLDRHGFAGLRDCGLVDDSEGSVIDYAISVVREVAGLAFLLFADVPAGEVRRTATAGAVCAYIMHGRDMMLGGSGTGFSTWLHFSLTRRRRFPSQLIYGFKFEWVARYATDAGTRNLAAEPVLHTYSCRNGQAKECIRASVLRVKRSEEKPCCEVEGVGPSDGKAPFHLPLRAN
jgi:hypothetical protein